jgi:hypothetical protein
MSEAIDLDPNPLPVRVMKLKDFDCPLALFRHWVDEKLLPPDAVLTEYVGSGGSGGSGYLAIESDDHLAARASDPVPPAALEPLNILAEIRVALHDPRFHKSPLRTRTFVVFSPSAELETWIDGLDESQRRTYFRPRHKRVGGRQHD